MNVNASLYTRALLIRLTWGRDFIFARSRPQPCVRMGRLKGSSDRGLTAATMRSHHALPLPREIRELRLAAHIRWGNDHVSPIVCRRFCSDLGTRGLWATLYRSGGSAPPIDRACAIEAKDFAGPAGAEKPRRAVAIPGGNPHQSSAWPRHARGDREIERPHRSDASRCRGKI